MRVYFLAIALCSLTGCYNKYLVLEAEAVSMTHKHGHRLNVMGDVSEKWCVDDEPVLKSDEKVFGLADQVIYKAQGKGAKADFITEVRIFRDSKGCALLEGKLAKVTPSAG